MAVAWVGRGDHEVAGSTHDDAGQVVHLRRQQYNSIPANGRG